MLSNLRYLIGINAALNATHRLQLANDLLNSTATGNSTYRITQVEMIINPITNTTSEKTVKKYLSNNTGRNDYKSDNKHYE